MAKRKTQAEYVATQIVKEVHLDLGTGWKHFSLDVRRGLAHTKVVFIILGQDESLPAASILEYMREIVVVVDELMTE